MDSVINIATVSGIPPLGLLVVIPPDTAVTFIPDSVALAIVKEAGVPTMVNGVDSLLTDGGDMIAYTFTVTNTGNVTLTDVFITDDGITFGGQAAQGSLSAISCDATTLASGDSIHLYGDVYIGTSRCRQFSWHTEWNQEPGESDRNASRRTRCRIPTGQ